MRIRSPSGDWPPNSSLRSLLPSTATGLARSASPGGRKSPWASFQCRMSSSSAVEPSTGLSRSSPRALTWADPTITGATADDNDDNGDDKIRLQKLQ